MRKIVIAAALAALSTPALAQAPASPAPKGSQAQMQPMTADKFAPTVAISDMFEIESSKAATLKAQSSEVKSFAQKMITDHQKTSSELKSMIEAGKVKNVQLPQQIDDEHAQKLQQLQGASGGDFDRLYQQMQVDAHKKAVSLFDSYARNGDNSDLKNWAQKTLPHLKEHLTKAEGIKVDARTTQGQSPTSKK